MDIAIFPEGNQSNIGPDFLKENLGTAIPYLTILSICMITGTFGNLLVICSVLIDKELRRVGNLFIINLAIADLCVTAYVDPLSIAGLVKGELWFMERPALCVFTAWFCLVSCFCSLLSIGFIALNRYIDICRHKLYNKVYTVPKTIAMCVGLWVFSIIIELPNFFGWGDHVYDLKTRSCIWDRTADHSHSIFISAVGVALPVILIAICYVLIYRYIKFATTVMKLLEAGEAMVCKEVHNIEKRTNELTRTVFICFVVFVLCWTPYALVIALDHKDVYDMEVHLYVLLLAHANSSINWIIYGASNRYFRQAYFRFLGISCYLPRPVDHDHDHSRVSKVNVPSCSTSEAI